MVGRCSAPTCSSGSWASRERAFFTIASRSVPFLSVLCYVGRFAVAFGLIQCFVGVIPEPKVLSACLAIITLGQRSAAHCGCSRMI